MRAEPSGVGNEQQRGSDLGKTSGTNVPLVDGLLILLVGLHEPLADANEAAVHEAALQQVVNGFEQQRATFIGKAVLPQPIILSWRGEREKQTGEDGKLVFLSFT